MVGVTKIDNNTTAINAETYQTSCPCHWLEGPEIQLQQKELFPIQISEILVILYLKLLSMCYFFSLVIILLMTDKI